MTCQCLSMFLGGMLLPEDAVARKYSFCPASGDASGDAATSASVAFTSTSFPAADAVAEAANVTALALGSFAFTASSCCLTILLCTHD